MAGNGNILNGVSSELGARHGDGLSRTDEGLQSLADIGWRQFRPFFLCVAALADIGRGNLDIAAQRLEEALGCVRVSEERWAEAEIHRCRAELALRRDNDQQLCEREHMQAMDLARAQGAKAWELRAAISLARLWADQGRRADAYGLLAPVYGWFTEGFDTADLKDARALLDELR